MDLNRTGTDRAQSPAAGLPERRPRTARLHVLDCVRRFHRSASTKEIAEFASLHPNGVRRHLESLAAERLVERRRVNRGRGRPRDEWVTTREGADADAGHQELLATWIAEITSTRELPWDTFVDGGRSIGRSLTGRETASEGRDADPLTELSDLFTALGFAPEFTDDGSGTVCCRLNQCPYRDAASANPNLVCSLHRGITEGALAKVAPDAVLRAWEPHDPVEAGCEALIDGLPSGDLNPSRTAIKPG